MTNISKIVYYEVAVKKQKIFLVSSPCRFRGRHKKNGRMDER